MAVNIHIFCNKGQQILYDSYFLPSLKDPWTVCYHRLSDNTSANFGTESFKKLIHEKIRILINEVFPAEAGNDYFIVSDIDIQFFASCDHLVKSLMKKYEIVFQSEHGTSEEVNTGFIAMKLTPAVINLWNTVEKKLSEQIHSSEFSNEQFFVNKILKMDNKLSWTIFPNEIWTHSNHELKSDDEGFKNILLHHANDTVPRGGKSSLQLKIEQLEHIKMKLKNWESKQFSRIIRRSLQHIKKSVLNISTRNKGKVNK